MTRRISLIAVCCASASLEFVGALLDFALQAGIRLAQLRGHAIEAVGKGLQLVAGVHLDALVEFAGTDALRAFVERADRPHHATGERQRAKCRDDQPGEQQQSGAEQSRH